MKKLIVLAVVLGLAGCAIPQDMKDNQQAERIALRQYQKAERDAFRAGELNAAAKKALVASTAAKIAADANAKQKEKVLNELLSK